MKEQTETEKNGNFVQFYRPHLTEVTALAKANPVALELFLFICEHMDGYNALMCSYQVFVDYTGKSRQTCSKAIKHLYDNGYIDILKSGTSNVYIINQEIAWTSWSTSKQYCQFNGNILVSAKENQDYFYKNNSKHYKKLDEPPTPTKSA